ncbi:hypothetical protein M0802_015272 [Mischocyttarus mexicanus]|nr:hypothetical protein M0802_015272 [Mischocyttarus mexicanus]
MVLSLSKYKLPASIWLDLQLSVVLEDPDQKKVRFISFKLFFLKIESSHGLEKSSIYDLTKLAFDHGMVTAPDTFMLLDLDLQSNPECKLLEYFTE